MDWKKILPIIGIILFVYILWRFNIEKILFVFSTINLLYAILCFLGIPIIFCIFNIQWQMILKRQCIHVSFTYSFKNLFISYFYGFITPGGFGAYLSALYLKNESKTPLPKCVSNIITFNTIDYITIFILGSIGGLFLLGQYPYLFILILILLFFVSFLFIFFLRQKTSKHLFNKLLHTQIFEFIQHYVEDPIESFYEDLPSFKSLVIPFLISFFSWFVFYTELYFIAQLFNIHITYITFIFMLAITSSIAIIPISIYGLGTRDAIIVALFSLYNIPPENSISFTLFWFTLFLITPSIIGVFITVLENKKLPSKKQR
ncbi:Lysylphosphatidylglycerol synthase TM region [uncultured archaeon]|nr:Lysylphosphatidylglycerol synthase TM region [uncultured archaeon]